MDSKPDRSEPKDAAEMKFTRKQKTNMKRKAKDRQARRRKAKLGTRH